MLEIFNNRTAQRKKVITELKEKLSKITQSEQKRKRQ
jgi:hypothetical protein